MGSGKDGFRWVARTDDLEALVRDLHTQPRVALDLEADSLYRYRERICLIQVSCPLADAIIDPLALPHIEPLRTILEDPRVEKVLHGGDYDVRLLKGVAGIRPVALFDTMVAARVLGLPRLGLSDLLEERFGVRLEKRFQRADWGKRPLTQDMARYAIEDTRHLLPLRDALAEELMVKGRLEWAREDFQALALVEPVPPTVPDALRVHGSMGLDDRGRAVLQALLEWREGEAQRRDIPTFKVLGTAVLVELAVQHPSKHEKMLRIHGITRKVLQLWGDGILKAVAKGLSGPPFPWRHERSPRRRRGQPRAQQRLVALKAIRDRRAAEMGLDPGALCPNSALKILAATRPEDLDVRLSEALKEWQRQLLGGAFRGVLN